jgi:hypothetical protein
VRLGVVVNALLFVDLKEAMDCEAERKPRALLAEEPNELVPLRLKVTVRARTCAPDLVAGEDLRAGSRRRRGLFVEGR